MTITDKIRELCKKKGISITVLENELGYGNGSLTKTDNENIKLNRLRAIATYFNVPISYFVDENKQTDMELEEYINSGLIDYLMGTEIFVDFCDQYRKKDGIHVLDLFEEYAKADSRFAYYEDEYCKLRMDSSYYEN